MSSKREERVTYKNKIRAIVERSAAFDSDESIKCQSKRISFDPTAEKFMSLDISATKDENIEIKFKQRRIAQMNDLFSKTRNLIKAGPAFRLCSYIYSERKIIVVIAYHIVISLTLWIHFSTIKFRSQSATVPVTANRYLWKVYTPTFEFGLMHTILFQMAILPLTMSRLSIANLSTFGGLAKLIPFNRMVNFHIVIGYMMIAFVCIATLFFFAFFGMLCADGETAFCDNLTSQIMVTGYLIAGLLLIVFISSYFRDRMPYELFYVIHHLVFILFLLTAAHTLDDKQRNGEKDRSQTFKWFTASLLYYMCDRAAMFINHRYELPVLSACATQDDDGYNRVISIKVDKPAYFQFGSGQYAYLRIRNIDRTWHPFAIASAPDNDHLEFIIEVCGSVDSWTNSLWKQLCENPAKNIKVVETSGIHIEVMGPYGCSFADTSDFSHAIIIGGGSGIVPMISLFKQNIHDILKLDVNSYFKGEARRIQKMKKVYGEKKATDGSLLNLLYSQFFKKKQLIPRRSIGRALLHLDETKIGLEEGAFETKFYKEIENSATMAMVPLYLKVLRLFISVLGMASISTTISSISLHETFITSGKEQIRVNLLDGTEEWLKIGPLVFQILYFLEVICVHSRVEFFVYLDITVLIVSGLLDAYCFSINGVFALTTGQVSIRILLMSYMWIRSWYNSINKSNDMFEAVCNHDRSTILSRLHLVWVTRSEQLVSTILPQLSLSYSHLMQEWGNEAAEHLCKISIYVTDEGKADSIREKMDEYGVPHTWVKIGERPDFSHLIDQHMIDRISEATIDEKEMFSNTLLAFCGSPSLAGVVHEAKIHADIAAISSGNKYHRIEFVSESYGYSNSSNSN